MSRSNKVSIVGVNTKLIGRVESTDVMIIAGQIDGDVHSQKVVIKEKGRVNGNISCKSLVIEPGGIFDGRASMTEGLPGEKLDQESGPK